MGGTLKGHPRSVPGLIIDRRLATNLGVWPVGDRTFYCRFKAYTQDFIFVLFYPSNWCYLLGAQPKSALIFLFFYLVVGISAFKGFKLNVYTLCTVCILVGYFNTISAG